MPTEKLAPIMLEKRAISITKSREDQFLSSLLLVGGRMEVNSGKSQTMHEKLSFPLNIPSENVTLRIWSHLLKKSLIVNFIFCVVKDLNRSIPYLHSEMEGLFLSKEMILPLGTVSKIDWSVEFNCNSFRKWF